MKTELRILCKSCGKNFGYLSYDKNCKSCTKIYYNKILNIKCRRCKKHYVSRPSDPMCFECYTEVERKNKELVEIYHKMGVILDEKDVG